MPNYYRTKILTSIKSLDEISLVLKKGVDIPLIGKPDKKIVQMDKQSVLKIHPVSIKGIKPIACVIII